MQSAGNPEVASPAPPRLVDAPRAAGARERWAERAVALAAALTVVVTVGIVLTLGIESARFFAAVSPVRFLTETSWAPTFSPPRYGIAPLLMGTFKVTVIAGVVAIPLGLLTALYLSEYAQQRTRSILKPVLETLAGIPTVVYGYFALTVVTPALRAVIPGMDVFNALSAGIVVGTMIVPTVSSLSEDAFRAVPDGLRRAAFGLGATRFEVALRVVLPSAASGVAAAFILALARAVGETMIVAIAAGNLASLSPNPLEATQTMTGFIVQVALGDVPRGTVAFHSLFAVGGTLFLFTLAMNAASQRILTRVRKGGR